MMNEAKKLSKQAQKMQVALYQASGKQAHLQTLIDANILMAYKVAREHIRSGVEFEDLVSEAVTGIIKAASRYDATKGASFTTFARQWMISQCQDFVRANCGTIRVTSRLGNLLHSKAAKIRKALGPSATPSQIAAYLGVDDVAEVEAAIRFLGRHFASLDKPINTEGATVATFVADEAILQDEKMQRTQDTAAIQAAIQSFVADLSDRDKDIFINRIAADCFNLDGCTAVELADNHNLTKQRVCQIERDLKNKLRNHFQKELS
jgi:RNA polymerase sigma factor (sigma-70 family)